MSPLEIERTRPPSAIGATAATAPPASLDEIFALAPARWLRRTPGRETFAWPPETPAFVVKRFRGGEARDFWRERARGMRLRSAARREAENLIGLRAAGIPVPEPLAWFEEPLARLALGRRGGRSALVLRYAPHAETLRERVARAQPRERRAQLAALARVVARMHAAGWYHRDLYLDHVVVGSDAAHVEQDGGLVLLDAGRARRDAAPARRWLVKDLAALLHSAPAQISRAERLRFLREYCRATGATGLTGAVGAAGRRWVVDVLAKRLRLAAHEPRHAFSAADQVARSR